MRTIAYTSIAVLLVIGLQKDLVASTRQTDGTTSAADEVELSQPLQFDDPVAIRDTLARHELHVSRATLQDRVRHLLSLPAISRPDDRIVAAASNRDLVFVVPVQHGIRYQAKKRLLTINLDLSDETLPGLIILQKSITGPNGRGLVVAPEAKSKGYIQHIDVVGIESGQGKKTVVRGHAVLSQAAFNTAREHLAVVLTGRLRSPYLNDRSDHSEPTIDDPTDITTRTSRLYVDIQEIRLMNEQQGTPLIKNLHLSK